METEGNIQLRLRSGQVSLPFHKWGKQRSEGLGDVLIDTREACRAPETEYRSIGSFSMQTVLGAMQGEHCQPPDGCPVPALPAWPHPHLEAQCCRRKLKLKN